MSRNSNKESTTTNSSLPNFSLSRHKYDLDTYIGRLRHCFEIFNPLLLFTTDEQLKKSQHLVQQFRDGHISTPDQKLNKELWNAKTICDAILHPQTQEKLLLPFRMSAFVPMNLPTICGMLLTSSMPAAIFWQWYNQSYNVCWNFANGNRSNTLSNQTIFTAYSIAVVSSCSVSLGLNAALKKSVHSLGKNTYFFLSKTVPFTAVATASVLNVCFMRYNEIQFGVDISGEKDGESVGKSPIAGKRAVFQTAFSRVILGVPILLFPAFFMRYAENTEYIRLRPRLHLSMNVSIFTFFLWVALPFACAVFPQMASLEANRLEKEFQQLGYERFWYNRGL